MEKKGSSVLNKISFIVLGGAIVGAIFVGIFVYFLLSSAGDPDAVSKALMSIVIMGIAFLLPVYMIRVLIDKFIVQKIKKVEEALHEVSLGNLDHEVKIEGDDELAELAEAFERMRISLKTIMEKLEKGEL